MGAAVGLLSPLVAAEPILGSCLSSFISGAASSFIQPFCNGICDKCEVDINWKCAILGVIADTVIGCVGGHASGAEHLVGKIQFLLGVTSASGGTLCN